MQKVSKMRLILSILIFLCLNSEAQVIRANPYYRPFPVAAPSCEYTLDTYTGAHAAYSTRKLRTAYSGSAIRVRRSNDNTEQDIGFTGCELDTASLLSFVGSNSGFVTTLYDQVNSNNATQTTQANQPRIVNAGVIERVNGKPALYYDGGDWMASNSLSARSRVDAYFVQSTSDATYLQFHSSTMLNEFLYVAQNGITSTLIRSNTGTPTAYVNNSSQSWSNRDNVHDALNGTKVICYENFSTTPGTNWNSTFRWYGYTGFEFTGYAGDMIFWITDQSANRSGINGSINTYWGVY